MKTRTSLRPLSSLCAALGVAVLAALLSAAPARAATFAVDPVSLTLARGNSSASVAITNQSTQKLRLQVTGFSWKESDTGEMQLASTQDIVFFPQILELGPGETKRVRIGVTQARGPLEGSYRVFMEELPSLESVVTPKAASVTIRMKVGIPVFLSPAGVPSAKGEVRGASANGDSLSFDVANTGNVHFSIQRVHVAGKNADGKTIVAQDLDGWYVLPGGTRRFTIPLSKAHCEALRSLSVNVDAAPLKFENSFSDISKRCGSSARP